jgi:TatA/E family protein of Tat protein translocase
MAHGEIEYVLGWMPGGMEWLVILLIMLLLFGRRLPEIMRGLGGSIREFKKGMDTEESSKITPTPPADGAVSRPIDDGKPFR